MLEKKSGRLVGIGIGPGDESLMTLRAVEALRSLDAVFVPRAAVKKASLAWEIASRHVPESCAVVRLLFPMTRSESELNDHWRRAAEPVAERIKRGEACGFLTLGDPMLYSTFIYLKEEVERLAPGTRCEIVPGISAGFAAAARAGVALARGDESIAFITGERADRLEVLVKDFDSIVIMKVGKRLDEITARLRKLGLAERSVFAQRLGLENELIGPLSEAPAGEEAGYMSTIIVTNRLGGRNGGKPNE